MLKYLKILLLLVCVNGVIKANKALMILKTKEDIEKLTVSWGN